MRYAAAIHWSIAMTGNPLPWYSDQEVDDLCTGLKNSAAKVRHLKAQGLIVSRKPNGRPLVMRSHAEMVLSGMNAAQAAINSEAKTTRQPNRAGLVMQFQKQAA